MWRERGWGGGEIDGAIAHSWVGNCQPGNLIYSVHALLTLSLKRQLYPSKVQGDNYKQVHPNAFNVLPKLGLRARAATISLTWFLAHPVGGLLLPPSPSPAPPPATLTWTSQKWLEKVVNKISVVSERKGEPCNRDRQVST